MLPHSGTDQTELETRPILEWLASAHENTKPEDIPALHKHLETLRRAQLPAARRVQLLDFLYEHSIKVVAAILPGLRDIPLPVPRKSRQEVRSAQDLLESLSRDYLGLVASGFEPEQEEKSRAPEISVWRAVNCLALHLMMSFLASAPAEVGIWRMLHDAYQMARRYSLADLQIGRAHV